MRSQSTHKNRKNKLQLIHQYYAYTGFYSFIWENIRKAILPFILVISGLFILDKFVIDFKYFFEFITENYSSVSLFSLFFASESFLGLIPPELFIAWVKTLDNPFMYLSLLALLSYLGGCVSYFIGKSILTIPKVQAAMKSKMAKHISNIRKWGGFLIIVGALLPIPFSMVSIASGIINYDFKKYLMFGLFRFLRFYLYALAIFSLMGS
ncbi:membrane protein YqaA with SNARE-associated domain [Ancylomarina subtilis]|uniref:Membrane protein YqaA with SNARE-associated domain n=1 Tax=Ancylomarina subtilis TaxID=1639035 RepID=A0A4Q7VHV8_9BACT|nr:VTT domain-containing protein [Ancylomarina subtilis]RZT95700.1 membrane protein YqaA with SNARE-associated domain [Ancylomarina subtilis]